MLAEGCFQLLWFWLPFVHTSHTEEVTQWLLQTLLLWTYLTAGIMSMNDSKFHKNPFLWHLGKKFTPYLLHYQLWNTPCYGISSHTRRNPTSRKIVVSDFIRALKTEQKTREQQQHFRAHFSSTWWAWPYLFMNLLTSRCQIQQHPKYAILLPSPGKD